MNYIIAKALAKSLIGLSFLTKTAGCVQDVAFPVKNKRHKIIPAAKEVFVSEGAAIKCLPAEDYTDLIPNSSETGILYFEDLGSKLTNSYARSEIWGGSLKLVCWVNHSKIENKTTHDLLNEIRAAIPQDLEAQGLIFAGKLKVTEVYPKRPSPFDKYGYDEKETQHLIYPFDYFSLKIEYTVHGAINCTGGGNILTLPVQQSNTASNIMLYSLNEAKAGFNDYDGKSIYVKGYIFDETNLTPLFGLDYGFNTGFDVGTIGRLVKVDCHYRRDGDFISTPIIKIGNTVDVNPNILSLFVANSSFAGVVQGALFIYYTKL